MSVIKQKKYTIVIQLIVCKEAMCLLPKQYKTVCSHMIFLFGNVTACFIFVIILFVCGHQ